MTRRLEHLFACILLPVSLAWTSQAQIYSVPSGGVWNEGSTWQGGVIPTSTDQVVIRGIVNIKDNDATVAQVTVESGATLQIQNSWDRTLTVTGDLTNNGTIRDRLSGNGWLYLVIGGDITNNGTWMNYRTTLNGSGNQTINQAAGTNWGTQITLDKTGGEVVAGSNLEIAQNWMMNLATLRMGGYDLTFRGSPFLQSGIVYTSGGLSQLDGSGEVTKGTRFIGTTTIRNTVHIGNGNVFEGTLIVDGTLQNAVNRDVTNTVEGHVINNGSIQNIVSNWWLTLNVTGDITNYGVWNTRQTNLTGSENQTLSESGSGTFFSNMNSDKPSGEILAESNLTFTGKLATGDDVLRMQGHDLIFREGGYVEGSVVYTDGALSQYDGTRSAAERSRFIGTTTIRNLVNLGANNVFEGTLLVADTLQNAPNRDVTNTVEGHLINEGTIRNAANNWWLFLNLQGSVTNRGVKWSNTRNYLNGDGMRTWDAPNVTAPMEINGGKITLGGDNVMSRFDISADNGPHVASGASLLAPPGSTDRITSDGRVFLLEDVSEGGSFGLYHSDFRVAAGAFDSLEVSHHGNQAPGSFSNAVRSHWTIRRVPETASGTIEWMTFGYTDSELGNNLEADLHVYHSEDEGLTWKQISSGGNTERNPDANTIKVTTIPSSGLFALSSDPEMITLLPSVNISIVGRDQIRLGPPNRYTIHYANASDVATGEMVITLQVNRNIHIDHIEPSAPDGVDADWLYPEDFAVFADSSVAPPDTVAVLFIQSMAPREERSFDVVLEAFPDGFGKGESVAPAIVVVASMGLGLGTAYGTDVMFAIAEEVFASTARTEAITIIKEGFRKTNEKWFSFEKPAGNLVKNLVKAGIAAGLGPLYGPALVMTITMAENFLNFVKAAVEGSSRYLNGGKTIKTRVEKPVEKVSSWDPNEKIGPGGYGEANFVTDATRMNYQILFENKAQATAPAWKIVIDDTLSTAFDASSVVFEGASHSGFEFSVNGQALHWEITGIELPPNVTPPEGEGYVSFSVNTVPGLSSGTALENRAVIVFDYNEPIVTNTFVNTLDFRAPTTTMRVLPSEVSGGDLVVRWDAVDADGESGVMSTNLFMSVDGQAFQSMGSTQADSMIISVEPLHDYRFYALSIDQVGNMETVRPALSTVSVISGVATESDELPLTFELDAAYPNPFNPVTTITYTLPTRGEAQLVVFDPVGRQVAELVNADMLPGRHSVRWDAGALASGVYFYRLTHGGQVQTRPVVLLK